MSLLAGIPFVPMQANWLQHSAAFNASSAKVVRARVLMFTHAWQSHVPGTLSIDESILSSLLGLTRDELHELLPHLMEGWTFNEGEKRIEFEPMMQIGRELLESHGPALKKMAAQAVLAAQDPDLFTLDGGKPLSKKQGKRLISDDFILTPEINRKIRGILGGSIYQSDEHVNYIFDQFVADCRTNRRMHADFDLALFNWASKAASFGLPWRRAGQQYTAGSAVSVPGAMGVRTGFGALPSKAEVVRGRNASSFANVFGDKPIGGG